MADTIKKNAKGYGYTYTDLAQIHEYLESKGWSYYQYIEVDANGNDYVMTVKINEKDEESKPIRGCRVVQATLSGKLNPAQEQGSALTYARRYSLLLAYGLATTDDDAQCLTRHAVTKLAVPTDNSLKFFYDKLQQITTKEQMIELWKECGQNQALLPYFTERKNQLNIK